MLPPPRLLAVHCPAGGGHRAAAQAIAEAAAEAGIECEVLDALELCPPWFARAYVGAHLGSSEHAPWLYGAGFHALDRRRGVAVDVRRAIDRSLGGRLLQRVRERAVRAPGLVVIGTHFFPLAALGSARSRGLLSAPLVGVVTDYAAHAFWAEAGVDRYSVAGRSGRDLVRHGVAASAIAQVGIPVRPAFARLLPPRFPGQDEPLEVLVTSGGFGVGPLCEVVRSFAALPRDEVRLTVVCGNNPERVAQVRRVAAAANVDAVVLGFERDMPARLARAHVVIGKPGGLTASECLAAGRPMLLVGACPGQEMLNQDWLTLQGAAVACAASSAGATLRALRSQLPGMSARAAAMARPHAARSVVALAVHELERGARRAA